MTTTEAGQASAPAEFPITWDDPAHEQAAWFQDVMHNPLPITPLTATLFQTAFAEGAGRGMAQLMLPITGLDISVQNGYVYLSPRPVSTDPEVLEKRFVEMQRITMELAPTVLQDWRETFEPQVIERAKKIRGFDYAGSSAAEIARFIIERRPDLVDVWDIHMRVNLPPMNAVFGLEEVVSGVLGDEGPVLSRQLLQGFDNKSIETGQALWALSRWVRSDDSLKAAVLASRVRNGEVEMPAHAKADEFQKRLRAFLDVYGWRSDLFFEIGHRSWHEDPSTPMTQLKGYIGKSDDENPFAAHGRHAEARGRLADELEARLPEELRPVFRALLPMAQQYIPIAEDHNFTIDQGFTAVMRYGILQLGKKLAADKTLSDPEDVFYLTFDEIHGIADGSPAASLDREVQRRRREHARHATLTAPIFIGTPPPEDAPPDPMLTKFFGVGLLPSENVNLITGHPCSTGVVTGIAKVVRTLDEADKLQPGDVLVCRMTMPAWTPLFGVAAAVVADSGGPLSHCAIVAREYGIPCIAGTVNGTSVLKDGMRVRVDGSTGTATILAEKVARMTELTIHWLGECHDHQRFGGKAASLSRLASRHTVPHGFAVPALSPHAGSMPDALAQAICSGYRMLSERRELADLAVAVRSSAIDEDGVDSSFAGQHDTYLNIRGVDEVLDAVARCVQSAASSEAVAYRTQRGLAVDDVRIAVLVQELVPSDVSAVAFSANPLTGRRDEVMINANWGLGESIVGGTATPDTFVVTKDLSEVLWREIACKERMTVTAELGTREIDVPPDLQSQSSLSDGQIIEIAQLATSLEAFTGSPVDIECTIADGVLYLLQCRPITTLR